MQNYELKDNFWKDKKVFVTGGTGFIGTWLVKELVDKGADVSVLVKELPKKNNFDKLELNKKTNLISGNILDLNSIKDCLQKNDIKYVFHLAAQSTVEKSLKQPLSAIETNILGTSNVLEACRKTSNIKSIVFASSMGIYGNLEQIPYKEDSRIEATNSIYWTSKMCADFLVQTYGKSFNLPTCSVRFSNIYGGGDTNFSRIVPGTIKQILSGKEIIIKSNGKFKLSFLYVKDTISAFLTLVEKIEECKLKGESFNFSGKPVFLSDLVKKIVDISGISSKINIGKGEGKDKYASSEKAEKTLNWHPQYNLEQGLKETFKWYKEYFKSNEKN